MSDKIHADNLLGQLASRVSEQDVVKGVDGDHYVVDGEVAVVFEADGYLVALTEVGRVIALEWPNTRVTRLAIVGYVMRAPPNDDVIDIEGGLVEIMPSLKTETIDSTVTVNDS